MKPYFLIFFSIFSLNLAAQDDSYINLFGKKWAKGTMGVTASIAKDKYYNNQYTFENLVEDTKHSSSFKNFNNNEYNQYSNFANNSNIYQFNVSLNPYSNKRNEVRTRHELRLSLAYYRGMENNIYFSNKYHRQSFGQHIPDTSYIAQITFNQLIDQVGIEGSYIIRSKYFLKRFNLFGGIGGGLSYSVFSQVKEEINTYTLHNISITTSSGPYSYDVTSEYYQYNYYKHNHAVFLRTILPYGVDFRLMDDLNIFLEGRSGFAYQKFLSGKGRARSFHSLGLGVRFKF